MITRRQGLLMGTAAALVPRAAFGAIATPAQTEGPFYPGRDALGASDGRLLRDGFVGQPIVVTGRVLGPDGAPLAGIRVDAWQADHEGHYNYPRRGEIQHDGFDGYGMVLTDEAGGYGFETIKPAPYGEGFRRTPHIHFKVWVDGREGLTTQMYFPGEPLNDQDGIFQRLGREGQQAALSEVAETGVFRFDIRL